MTRHYSDLGSASDWSCRVKHYPDLSSNSVISMEFLRSFLRGHFAGNPVVALTKYQLFSEARVTRTDDVDVVKEKSVSQLQLTFTICC